MKSIDLKKQWLFYGLLIWFALPFAHSFYPYRQNGMRYVIEMYAPLSLIAALGLEHAGMYLKKRKTVSKAVPALGGKEKYILLGALCVYLFVSLESIKPYYLNYFSEAVGGVNGIYKNKMFQIGWWGEGQREVALYLERNAPKGSRIGLQVTPVHTVKYIDGFRYEEYNFKNSYDYVIVNYYSVLRGGFNEEILEKDYEVVYSALADKAPLVKVYKRKSN